MQCFDVIFATSYLDRGDFLAFCRQQQAGSAEYVARAVDLHARYAERLACEAGDGLVPLFGFNITLSIAAMQPSLPASMVATTCEFPAVLSLLRAAGHDLAAWVCPFTKSMTKFSPVASRTLLLVSQVDYISGQNILDDVIETVASDPSARKTRFTVIVDGAHGIGNICSVAEIAGVRAAIEARLPVENFAYVFDFNKWLHGYPGLAVCLHTGISAPSLESLFPRPPGPAFGEFGDPVSVSYNPLLPHWMANFAGPGEHAFDSQRPKANEELTRAFRALTENHLPRGLKIFYANSNIALLTAGQPHGLFNYLGGRKYKTHLMGAARTRGAGSPGRDGGVRVAFSSHSVGLPGIQGLASALREYEG